MIRLGITYRQELDCLSDELCQLIDVLEITHGSSPAWWTGPITRHLVRTSSGQRLSLLQPTLVQQAVTDDFLASSHSGNAMLLSVHLGYPCAIHRIGAHNFPLSPVVSEAEAVARFNESLRLVRSLYPGTLAVENLDYHEGGAYEHICTPRFISTILENNRDLGLLLDISHAEVSAVKLGGLTAQYRLQAAREYINRLPLERLVEIHLCAPVVSGNDLADTEHAPVTEIELALLEELLSLPQLRVVNLESTKNELDQLRTISEIMKHHRCSRAD
ncbi:DUF692 family multinuclear iron-containing protein [Candidatus Eisenbacteria bacterium]|uniref:DUF692 family multinuclear iron-containing protein n=1 Tax=Eiseniibacteriota bacterium TaxID=2212470 RepID=A0ABV6YK71_UNCEI